MKRRTSRYLILITFVLILIVPITRFYTIDTNINACMIEYVDSLDQNNGEGFIYKIDGVNHIEAKNSIFNQYILEHKVGYSQGCVMASGDLFTDFNNSIYCSITYITKKAVNFYTGEPEKPMKERFKIFETQKTKFFTDRNEELVIGETLLLESFESNSDTVGFSLKILKQNFVETLRKF